MTSKQKVKSRATLKPTLKCIIWARAAGRCQYPGCNKPLWKDDLTQIEFNNSYLAHIVAVEPNGPRGDPIRSPLLETDPANIMLLCDTHHRLIDKEDVAGHHEAVLQRMKLEHELRVETQTELTEDHRSEIISYQANVGPHLVPLHLRECADALRPSRYPSSSTGIGLGMNGSVLRDGKPEFWAVEERQLRQQFADRIQPRLTSMPHASVFALAPQPLLILFGHLLSDLATVNVHQRRRNPQSWKWPEKPEPQKFTVTEPASGSVPAIVFSLTAKVAPERILSVLPDAAIWEVSLERPHHDCIQSATQLAEFKTQIRTLLDLIKRRHPAATEVHVFPVMPVSTAVEVGRAIQPKAHLPMVIYDENHGFSVALRVP